MKINLVRIALASCLLLLGSQQGYSQGTFVNLGFESVILPLNPGINSSVPISNALPGWTAYLYGIPRDWVLYNSQSLGGSSVSLMDSLTPIPALVPIQGSYSVYLHAGAGIGQTGQVPNGAASLVFLLSPASFFNVPFQGQNIPIVQLATSGNNLIMAGNISSFAGQTGQLLFDGGGLFDAIQFSSQPIPEPSAVSLLALGALLSAGRLRRGRTF